MDTGSFPGVKRARRSVDHPPPPTAEVKERVELYIYSLFVHSNQYLSEQDVGAATSQLSEIYWTYTCKLHESFRSLTADMVGVKFVESTHVLLSSLTRINTITFGGAEICGLNRTRNV